MADQLSLASTHSGTELERARESERRMRDILEALPTAVYTTDTDGRITYYNQAAVDLWGVRPELGRSEWCGSWKLYNFDGTFLPHDQCPMAVALKEQRSVRGEGAIAERPDGKRIPFQAHPTPIRDSEGRMTGALNMLVDISERKEAEKTQQLLIGELNHRVKNALATVQAIASQTLRYSKDPADFNIRFSSRLRALTRTHMLLTRSTWAGADLRTLISDQLTQDDMLDRRIRYEGPELSVAPQAALHLALVLHELHSNAVKSGALSAKTGCVEINWLIKPSVVGECLELTWTESGGPEVAPPTVRGLGTLLIEQSLKAQGGLTELRFHPAGVVCEISLPLRN